MMSMLYFIFMLSIINLKDLTFMSMKMELNQANNFIMIITFVLFLIMMNMEKSAEKEMKKKMMILCFILIGLFSNASFYTTNIFLMLLFIELTMLPMAKNFLHLSSGKEKGNSLMFMVNINLAGSLMFMWFSSSMLSMETYLASFDLYNSKNLYMTMMFSFMLLTKIPMIFSQFWLTKAHVSASGSCSMLLASVMLKLGSYGLMKFMSLVKMSMSNLNEMAYSLNLMGATLIMGMMIRFQDMKLMVACSSIVHMSLTIPLMFHMTYPGTLCSLMVMVNHGLISCLLFFFITTAYEFTSNRTIEFNTSMESLNKQYVLILIALMFMNMGIPPMLGFYTELIAMMVIMTMSSILLMLNFLNAVLFVLVVMVVAMMTGYGKKTIKNSSALKIQLMSTALSAFMIVLYLPFFMN